MLYEPEIFRTTRPFASLTGGVTHYQAQEPGRLGEWRFSGGFAGGVKRSLIPHVGVRGNARILFTFLSSVDDIFCTTSAGCLTGVEGAIVAQGLINATGSIFCFSGGGCLTNVQGTGLAQLLLTAGLTFKLGR